MEEISFNWIFKIFYGNNEFSISSRAYPSQKEAVAEAKVRISKLILLDRKNGSAFTDTFSYSVIPGDIQF